MRYGILSDVHGNVEALESVLAFFEACGLDRIAFLGDAVGYGANPNEVCDILRARCDVAVLGNHDAAVCGRMPLNAYRENGRHALRWTAMRLSDENHRWLVEMPYSVKENGIEFVHGNPVDPAAFHYLFTPHDVWQSVGHPKFLEPFTFVGHTHRLAVFRWDAEGVKQLLEPGVLDGDAKYVISDGSVGQPRDKDRRSSCMIFDTESKRIEVHRIAYDVDAAARKIREGGLDPFFADRLARGV